MKRYELTYLISSEISEEKVKSLREKVISSIREEGEILAEINSPVKKKLAYPIKKQSQAFLSALNFQLSPEKLADLEKKLRAESQILRYLILTQRERKIIPRTPRTPVFFKKPQEVAFEKPAARAREKKVELKEIEKKLEEILNK